MCGRLLVNEKKDPKRERERESSSSKNEPNKQITTTTTNKNPGEQVERNQKDKYSKRKVRGAVNNTVVVVVVVGRSIVVVVAVEAKKERPHIHHTQLMTCFRDIRLYYPNLVCVLYV